MMSSTLWTVGLKRWDWEIELFGTGKQAVLPPSVHPDSGENYAWGREIDWDLLDLGVGPVLSSESIAAWPATCNPASTGSTNSPAK